MALCPFCKRDVEPAVRADHFVCPVCGNTGRPTPPPAYLWEAAHPGDGHPPAVTARLLPGERVRHFTYLPQDGWLAVAGGDEHWVALTDLRVLYKARVLVGDPPRAAEREGSLPLGEVAAVLVEPAPRKGPLRRRRHLLTFLAASGDVRMPVAAKSKGDEVRDAHARLRTR